MGDPFLLSDDGQFNPLPLAHEEAWLDLSLSSSLKRDDPHSYLSTKDKKLCPGSVSGASFPCHPHPLTLFILPLPQPKFFSHHSLSEKSLLFLFSANKESEEEEKKKKKPISSFGSFSLSVCLPVCLSRSVFSQSPKSDSFPEMPQKRPQKTLEHIQILF